MKAAATFITDNPIVNGALTLCGLVPGAVGAICGVVSTAAYLIQGRYGEAAVSALSIVGAGAAGLAVKLAAKVARIGAPVVRIATATHGTTRAAITAQRRYQGTVNLFSNLAEVGVSATFEVWNALEPIRAPRPYDPPNTRFKYRR